MIVVTPHIYKWGSWKLKSTWPRPPAERQCGAWAGIAGFCVEPGLALLASVWCGRFEFPLGSALAPPPSPHLSEQDEPSDPEDVDLPGCSCS